MQVMHQGTKSGQWKSLQAADARRLNARDLGARAPKVDGIGGPASLAATITTAWVLGALQSTLDHMRSSKTVPVGVQALIFNPGRRTTEQKQRGAARLAQLRADRKKKVDAAGDSSHAQLLIVQHCLLAARNYRAHPGAYHYLAGGQPNLIYLSPSPLAFRSDCSQFSSAVQKGCGLPDLGPNGPLWVNTDVMDQHLELTDSPEPGDIGMYGVHHGGTHHTERYLGGLGIKLGGAEFIGHGSPPIDSLTPGRPDFYLKNPTK